MSWSPITFSPFCPPNRDFQHMVILSKPWHPNGTIVIPSWYSWMFIPPYIPYRSFIAKSTHPHISTIFPPYFNNFPPYVHHISTVFHHISTIFPHCAELRKWCSAAVAKVAVDPPRRECRARPAACSASGCRNHGQFLRENDDRP